MLRSLSLGSFAKLSPENSGFIGAWRGAAALVVLLAHMEQVYLAPMWIKAYPYCILVSQLSVMVFFVLSGFLIGKSITRKTSSGAFSLAQYAIDRAWRIVPPLLLSFAVMAVLFTLAPFSFPGGTISYLPTDHYVVVEEYAVRVREILSSALFVNGFFGPNPLVNGPLWSLAFEVWLYALAGIAVATRRSKIGLVCVVALFAILSHSNHNFAAYSIVWISGFLLCLAHNNGGLTRFARLTFAIVAPVSALIAIVLAYKYVSSFNHSAAPRLAEYRYVIVFNLFAGIGFAAALGTRLDRTTISVPVLRRSSDYSYTLYIVHYPILLFAFGVLQLYIQRSVFAAAATALVSLVAIVFFAKRAALLVESRPALTAFFGHLQRVRN